jgi:hypothetical protein
MKNNDNMSECTQVSLVMDNLIRNTESGRSKHRNDSYSNRQRK